MARKNRFAVPKSDTEFERLLETEPTVLLLRVCREDLTTFDGAYQWPGVGGIARPEKWSSQAKCGNGLHGWLWGKGDSATAIWEKNNVALVFRALERTVVFLDGMVKVPACRVEFVGTLEEAAEWIEERLPKGEDPGGIIGRVVDALDWDITSVGNYGTVTAGVYAKVTAGDYGTATVAFCGMAMVGDYGTAVATDEGVALAGDSGTAMAGHDGIAIAGERGRATVGDGGEATAGYYGIAIAGKYGRASARFGGTVTAGKGGTLILEYWDPESMRDRVQVAYVGENGIKPNVAYRLDRQGRFEKVQEQEPE
jgi:hypothetical protein